MSVWSYNSRVLHFVAKIVPSLAIGSSYIWLLYPFDIPPSLCVRVCVYVWYFLTFGTARCPKFILFISCQSSRISCFSRDLSSFYWKMLLETKFWVLGMLVPTEMCLIRGPLSGKKQINLCVCYLVYVSSVSSVAQSCPTLGDPMNCSTPGLPVHHQLPEFTQTHIHRVSDAIQPSHPLSSPSLPAPHPSQRQSLFQWVNSSHEVAKVLEFSFSIIPSKEIPGLISFRMDWLDLLAVQGTLKSLLQHHIFPYVSICICINRNWYCFL